MDYTEKNDLKRNDCSHITRDYQCLTIVNLFETWKKIFFFGENSFH